MSYDWNGRDFRRAQPARAPSGLSRSLATALFGAVVATTPGSAAAAEGDDRGPASPATVLSAAVSAATPAAAMAATAALPSGAPAEAAAVAAVAAAENRPSVTLPVAASAEQRSYGPLRPGLGTPANTMAAGDVSVETGFVDWQRDDSDGVRSDTLLIGSTLVRVGVTRSVEAMVDWTPFGHVRVRDETGAVEQANRVGDVLLGFKANLAHPDGSGLSAAIQPFVVLPVGRAPVGVGDWGAGVVVPVSYDLSKSVNVAVTGEVDAATNSTGQGRHLSYSVVGGLSLAVTPDVKVTGELSGRQDQDPVQAITQAFASLSLAWTAAANLQFDVGAAAGLNRDSPDLRLYGGISRRF